MKSLLMVGLLVAPMVASAQFTKKMTYDRPQVTEEQLWELEYESRPEELELKANKEDQETVVHRQTRSVAKSESVVERSRSAALDYKLLGAPGHRPNLDDRLAASLDQERVYPRMAADVAILELIYRRMLGVSGPRICDRREGIFSGDRNHGGRSTGGRGRSTAEGFGNGKSRTDDATGLAVDQHSP